MELECSGKIITVDKNDDLFEKSGIISNTPLDSSSVEGLSLPQTLRSQYRQTLDSIVSLLNEGLSPGDERSYEKQAYFYAAWGKFSTGIGSII